MAREGSAARKTALEHANAAVQSYHALVGAFPTVAEVDEARDAAQALERKIASIGTQSEKLKVALTRSVDDLLSSDQLLFYT